LQDNVESPQLGKGIYTQLKWGIFPVPEQEFFRFFTSCNSNPV